MSAPPRGPSFGRRRELRRDRFPSLRQEALPRGRRPSPSTDPPPRPRTGGRRPWRRLSGRPTLGRSAPKPVAETSAGDADVSVAHDDEGSGRFIPRLPPAEATTRMSPTTLADHLDSAGGGRYDSRMVSTTRSRASGRKKADDPSVERVRQVLEHLECPDARRGEGTEEWSRSKGSFRFTPDLVAGPLVGGGDPSDFYIDVLEPTGDQFVKPKAGNPLGASRFLKALAEHGSINLAELGDTGELVGTMNAKLKKYVDSRANTPMFGLSIYFTMTGNQYLGPLIAGLQAMNTLDGAFGITEFLGHATKDRLLHDLVSRDQTFAVLPLPIRQPLSFVMNVVEKVDGPKVHLLVNTSVGDGAHPFANHPVVRWLREIRPVASTLPPPAREPG